MPLSKKKRQFFVRKTLFLFNNKTAQKSMNFPGYLFFTICLHVFLFMILQITVYYFSTHSLDRISLFSAENICSYLLCNPLNKQLSTQKPFQMIIAYTRICKAKGWLILINKQVHGIFKSKFLIFMKYAWSINFHICVSVNIYFWKFAGNKTVVHLEVLAWLVLCYLISLG